MKSAPLIVAGSGRSGTTWVFDAISEANELRTVFEPLHPEGVPEARDFSYKYLDSEDRNDALKLFMDKVFQGQLNSLWVNYRVFPNRLIPGRLRHGTLLGNYQKLFKNYFRYRKHKNHKRIIIKLIRANLMLGWLATKYSGLRIVLLVRHPCAVVSSKLLLGGPLWSHEKLLNIYLSDSELLNRHLSRFSDILNSSMTPATAHTLIWCIENAIPMAEAKKYGYCIILYEELLVNGLKEWERITEYLRLNKVPNENFINMPSQQASKKMFLKKNLKDKISSWMGTFDQEELDAMQQILDAFDVRIYKSKEPMPVSRN